MNLLKIFGKWCIKNNRYLYTLFIIIIFGFSSYAETIRYNPWLADYTSPELEVLLSKGYDRILIPTAGIEQNAQFAPLNKHQKVLEYTIPKIAHRLGKTLIAPIVNFVPEGDIEHKEGHMAFAGTLSMPDYVFQLILLNVVRSLEKHGFKKFYFLGDSGGNQIAQEKIAHYLQSKGYHAYSISEYYANNIQDQFLQKKYGFTLQEIGTHIGIRDTSELLYASEDSIRHDKITNNQNSNFIETGGNGNALLANKTIGKELLDLKINETVKVIYNIENISH